LNHWIHSRTTHLKIVAVPLLAGIAIAGLGLLSRANTDASKLSKPVMSSELARQ
jgi:hypothetical protein